MASGIRERLRVTDSDNTSQTHVCDSAQRWCSSCKLHYSTLVSPTPASTPTHQSQEARGGVKTGRSPSEAGGPRPGLRDPKTSLVPPFPLVDRSLAASAILVAPQWIMPLTLPVGGSMQMRVTTWTLENVKPDRVYLTLRIGTWLLDHAGGSNELSYEWWLCPDEVSPYFGSLADDSTDVVTTRMGYSISGAGGVCVGTGYAHNQSLSISNELFDWSGGETMVGVESKLSLWLFVRVVDPSQGYSATLSAPSFSIRLLDTGNTRQVNQVAVLDTSNVPQFYVAGDIGTTVVGTVESRLAGSTLSTQPVRTTAVAGVAQPVILVGTNTDKPVWVSEQQPATTSYSWSISSEDRNRAMHALHGNTFRLNRDAPCFESRFANETLSFDDPEAEAAYLEMMAAIPQEDAFPVFENKSQPPAAPAAADAEVAILVTIPGMDSLNVDPLMDRTDVSLVTALNHAVFAVDCTNYYADLPIDEEDALAEPLIENLPVNVPVRSPPKPKEGSAHSKVSDAGSVRGAPAPAASVVAAPVDLAARRKSVLKRIVTRLSTDVDMFMWVASRGVCHEWAWQVSRLKWGHDWARKPDSWSPAQTLFSVWLRVKAQRLVGPQGRELLAAWGKELVPEWANLVVRKMSDQLERESPGWWSSVKVLETERDAHNQFMHAYNGNPVQIPDMKTVLTMPRLDDYDDEVKTSARFDGAVAELAVNTTKNGTNPHNATLGNRAILRCRTQNVAGAIQDIRAMEPLENYMFPRHMWDPAGVNLIPSVYGTSWAHFSAFNVRGLDLTPTLFWNEIGKAELEDRYQMGRADNVAPNGFRAWDVKYIGKTEPVYGLEMSTFALKMKLWHSILVWQPGNGRYLPLSNDLGRFDPRTITQDGNLNALTVNDGPIPAENWGGNASVFPTLAGQAGTLTFHICMDSVPEEHKSNVIVFPRIFASIFPNNPGKALAIFVACLAPWPFCSYFLPRLVSNDAGPGVAPMASVLFGNLVKVDGILDLHILLPRQGTGSVPGTPADATSRTLVRPSMGPNGSAVYLPNAPIQVAYVNNAPPVFQVDLCQYLYTWALGVSYLDLAIFSTQMHRLTDMAAWFNIAEERVASVVVRYSPMTTALAPVHNAGSHTTILPDGRRLHYNALGAPLDDLPPSHIMPAFNVTGWNHLALNTRTCPAAPPCFHNAGPMWTRPAAMYWRGLFARHLAYTIHIFWQQTRLMQVTWNNCYAVGANEETRAFCRSMFTGGARELALLGSTTGPSLHNIWKKVTGTALYSDQFSNTLWDYMYFHEHCYRTVHTGVVPTVWLDTYVPSFLPDIWLVGVLDQVPQCMAPYPTNFSLDSTCGLVREDMTIVAIAAHQAPPAKITNQTDRLDEYSMSEWDDYELWNLRLFVQYARQNPGIVIVPRNKSDVVQGVPTLRVYSMSANVLEANVPVAARISRTDFDGCQSNLPLADDTGQRIWYTVDANVMTGIQNIMIGLQRAMMETFIFANAVPHSALHWSTGTGRSGHSKAMMKLARNYAAKISDPPGDLPLAAAIEGLSGGVAAALAEPALLAAGAAVAGGMGAVRMVLNAIDPVGAPGTGDGAPGINLNQA